MLVSVLALGGCSKKKGPEENPDMGNFVSASAAGTYSSTQLKMIATAQGYGAAADFLKYDVSFVKLVYRTNYKGVQLEASGLLAVPKNVPGNAAVLSAQHGTVFLKEGGPSGFPAAASVSGYELLASTGFITVMPDYIGFNASRQIAHPYYHMGYSASAVVDMLKAVIPYLKREKIAFNERLFLLGYSEGGYVTLAAQKEIETTAIPGLALKGVAAGAGGYDLPGILAGMSNSGTYKDPAYLAILLNGYNMTLGWNRPFTDFFKEPYADRMPALLDGTKGPDVINAQLTTNLSGLLNADFYAGLKDVNGEKILKVALTANSFGGWAPKVPTRLYHGTADETVPYQSTLSAFAGFNAAQATDVALMPVAGGTHESAVLPMVLSALPWFQSLDK